MFQYQVTSDIRKSQVDVSGKCKVVIKADGKHVKKSKEDCVHPDREQYEHPHLVGIRLQGGCRLDNWV